ncbi:MULTISPECIES: response regulator transcription factor [Pedobacter]|uniref:Response regulator receiver n=1 Tax=Pedobacter heparinus (strain ATCC 13125 / DSM 2366 / CIP 104194 / JCM 7457 / NBRC 12017 / NCIMB 9290 / NRRL B-14731 / HIM 762-3) TaxID=485917 RepID=C6XUH9_PEDHD|nr:MULTISPECIES: response regulator transcription factor [Pedobacter]ACU03829.1 response regulator receiver [Pedobacter heparinus DSM 2366]MBB5436649.1 DNA-binding NarL/FixJ family response regulator [Pedobacter sp. AK017]
MQNQAEARVVIIEDDQTIREGYTYLINNTSPYQVVNTYPSFDAARQKIGRDNPDVIILDIQMPGTNGIDALPLLKKTLPDVYIIMLTVHETEKIILEALANGASGYFTKNTPSSKIIEAIKDVLQGGGPMSPNVAKKVITSLQKNPDSPLTKRETQILSLMSRGKDRSQIANELFIEIETVKTHIKNIYLKLDVNSKADAIKVAKNNRLV